MSGGKNSDNPKGIPNNRWLLYDWILYVWMWELDYKESWVPKNGCFWTVVLEKTLDSPLDSKEIQPVHPKRNQSWIVIGRTDAEAETPILWPPDAKNWLIGKDPDVGKDWRQEEKGMTEDEMVGRYHWLNGHEFEWTQGLGDGQGGLACCGSWGCKESDTPERLNWTESTVPFSFEALFPIPGLVCWDHFYFNKLYSNYSNYQFKDKWCQSSTSFPGPALPSDFQLSSRPCLSTEDEPLGV